MLPLRHSKRCTLRNSNCCTCLFQVMNKSIFQFFFIIALTLSLCVSSGFSSSLKDAKDELTFLFYTNGEPVQFIVVEKQTQKLMLFELGDTLKLLKTFTSVTGENPGTKMVSGDSRTPEGFYYITEVYKDNKITVFGSRAFHLDYPNPFDTQAGRLGNGIFIHGTNKTLIPYSTNGCITLNNSNLDDLAPHLSVNTTPVIVVDTLDHPVLKKKVRLLKSDSRYREILTELSVDSKEFAEENINNLYFLKWGSQAVASVSYSVPDGDFLQYRYHKRVYLTPAVTRNWRNLYAIERQSSVPAILAMHPVKNQALPVATKPVTKPAASQTADIVLGEDLLEFVEKWRSAWSNKDTDTYMGCYSPSFTNGRLDVDGWRKKKSYLNKKYNFIKVSIKNIVVEWTDYGAKVSFFQDYKSDQYQVSGTKFLQLINKDNKWMIQKEIM